MQCDATADGNNGFVDEEREKLHKTVDNCIVESTRSLRLRQPWLLYQSADARCKDAMETDC